MLTLENKLIKFTNGAFTYQASINNHLVFLKCDQGGSLSWSLNDYNLGLVNDAISELKAGYNNHRTTKGVYNDNHNEIYKGGLK